ncbi:MAG: type III-A CRISPR-associated protein Csm2 [Thermodesulfobacteriota bacterium]
MQENKIQDAIIRAKKFNIALRAIQFDYETKKLKWSKYLPQIEEEFKVNLDESEKQHMCKKRDDLKKDLEKQKLHDLVIQQIPIIFQIEEKKGRDGREKKVPTKQGAETLNNSAELIGLLLKAYEISTSQIRRYLDSLRKIKVNTSTETFSESEVLLQQVKIAYAAGRDSDLNFLYEVMKPAIKAGSEGYHCLEQLLKFVEAIVAYHRFYRGED